ncbi:GIY-YIG nuclease family protein [Microcoleus sp. MOSTC5]|uniref:GIY-YIG nuclease family protein n=1 Tax=Microcoleus sp. MOSTC5 TaxID=3055378 RepID=UPI002FD28246
MNETKLVKLKTNPQPGYIYLVNAVGTDKFKIGKTAVCVIQRIKQLQTGSHVQLRYVYHAYVENMNLCEMEVHRKFADKRQIGEWFKLMPIDVNECIELMRLVHQENLTLEDLNNKIGFPQNHVEGKLII